MKRYLYILAALALVAACDKPEQPSQGGKDDKKATLSVFPSTETFEATPSEAKTVTLSSNTDWKVTEKDEWITVSPASGTGNASLNLSVTRNTGVAREGKVTFQDKAGTVTAVLTVKQNGGGEPEGTPVTPSPAAFDGNKRASTTYQLLIYSFADSDGDGVGDFKGIQNRLDYLDGLGATALWLSPAHPTSSYHAYDVNDYNTVNPLYGSEADFKSLIDAAHAKGIRIYMDFVLNHTGLDNVWFQSVSEDPQNSPYKDFYVLSANPVDDVNAGRVDNYAGANKPGMGDWYPITVGKTGYTGRLHFVLDSGAKTITVTKTDAAADTPPATSDWYIYCNSFKGMKKTAEGKYEITLDIDTEWGFLVCSKTDWSSGSKFGASSPAGAALQFGTPFSLYGNSNNDLVGNITFGGYTTNYFASFARSMPDLNYGKYTECENSGAFKATVEAATKWVNLGVDGFRLDAVIWIYQNQVKANQRFLDQWYKAVNAAYKKAGHTEDIFMVGEAWMDHNTEKQYYQGLTSCFEFDYFSNNDNSVLRQAVNGNAGGYVSRVNQFINDHKSIRSDAVTSFFLTNHDQPRAAEILNKDADKLKQAAAMLLTTPGKPFVYQGEELGYYGNQGGGDEYVRTPILWDKAGKYCAKNGVGNKVDGNMLSSSISVEAQEADANSLLNVYKTWSRLRNTYPALADGTMTATSLNGGTVASWYMTAGGEKMLVIHNTGGSPKTMTVSDDVSHPVALLGTAELTGKKLKLGAHSSVVFQQ